MSQVKISGNASGTGVFTVASPNSNNTQTLTLPDATATLVGDTATQTLTNKTLTSPTITGASMSSMASSVITSGTAVASTSGTSIDFTGLPSWVKRITVCWGGVSLSGTADFLVQLGTSSGFETTGYLSASEAVAYTAGFGIRVAIASWAVKGTMTINLLGNNIWCMSTNTYLDTGTTVRNGAGTKTMSGTVDRLRITTSNGTDTFDAGSINILYE